MHDAKLLDDYVMRKSEAAFRSLVSRYLNLVFSTAMRQARNEHLAQDIAQTVFILLARKAARLRQKENVALGGWLYRTTRFVTARALRGEARRHRREQEAFQMQQLTSADETWRQIAPLLDEGIEHLGQTDREVVVLRFLQEEPLQKVGQALGISEEAARKRANRSLEKLRAFFVRRGFTISTGALATGLVAQRSEAATVELGRVISAKALACANSGTAALPPLAAGTLQAWHWATLKFLGGIGVAATVITTVAVTALRPPERPNYNSQNVEVVPKTSPILTQSPTTNGVRIDKSSHFAFQAVDAETGKPLAKVKVIVESIGSMNQVIPRPQQVDQQDLRSDIEGRCDIRLPYEHPLMLMIGVLADGYEERSIVGGQERPLANPYVLKVPRGARIGGVVKDESGHAVPDAAIQILFNGTGDYSNREFQQERPGFPSDDSVATTDTAGHWAFGSAPTNGDFMISVAASGFPSATFHNDDEAHFSPGEAALKFDDLRAGKAVLTLKSGVTLRGTVTDEHGYNVAGAKVGVGRYFFREKNQVSTEADGTFVISGLAVGENYVTVQSEGFAPQRIQVDVYSNTAPLAVQLKAGSVLRLRVVDQNGAPIANARIGLDKWKGPNTLAWGAITDTDGWVVWKSAPPEPMVLSVLKDGYFFSRQNSLTADGQEHVIALQPQLIVDGQVTDAKTGQPIPFFKAVPEPNRDETVYGSNGAFELRFAEPANPLNGPIEADGYVAATSNPLDPKAGHLTCDFQLKAMNAEEAIQGAVMFPDGSAASDVPVATCGRQYGVQVGQGRLLPSDDSVKTRTDADGHFSFSEDVVARAVVAACPQGIGTVLITPTNRSVVIQLQPWGRIEGVLRLRNKSDAGQSVVLSEPPTRVGNPVLSLNLGAYTTKTDDGGNFVFEQAPPGIFKLYLNKGKGPYSHDTTVDVQPGATTTVQMGGTGQTVAGRLALASAERTVDWSKQLPFAVLETKVVAGPESHSYPLEVQADGTFTVDDIPPGDYRLDVQLSDTEVDTSMGNFGHVVGFLRKDVTVPEVVQGGSGKIDLGMINVPLAANKAR